jgi:hypothetical protein
MKKHGQTGTKKYISAISKATIAFSGSTFQHPILLFSKYYPLF